MSKSFSLTFHRWSLAIIPEGVNGPVYGGIMARGTKFDGNTKVDDTEYQGHMGTKTLTLQNDRTAVTAEPQYTHGAIFGELFEDYWKLLLGGSDEPVTVATAVPGTGETTFNVYKWKFYQDLVNGGELPRCTLINAYNGVSKSANDARIYDNALMSEFGLTIDDKGIELQPKFSSNAPIINQPNPTMTTASELSKLGLSNVKVYMCDPESITGFNLLTIWEDAQNEVTTTVGTTGKKPSELLDLYLYGCVLSSENTWKTNPSEDACIGNKFGTSSADPGAFEDEGKLEVLWNANSKIIMNKWYTGTADGTDPTDQSCFQQILITMGGRTLAKKGATVEITKDINEYCNVYMPNIEITDAQSDESGDDTKTIKLEYGVRELGTVSPVTVTMQSKLAALHYGTAA